jgi:hypothetical protein
VQPIKQHHIKIIIMIHPILFWGGKSHGFLNSIMLYLTLQRGGFKHPVHTVVWEGFSSGHLNFERSAASSACHSTTGGDFAMRAALVTPR